SLLHFLAGYPGWVLPTVLPCGARTFLGANTCVPRRGRLTDPFQASTIPVADGQERAAATLGGVSLSAHAHKNRTGARAECDFVGGRLKDPRELGRRERHVAGFRNVAPQPGGADADARAQRLVEVEQVTLQLGRKPEPFFFRHGEFAVN